MRIAIALCLLAIFCTADATFINIVLRQIQNAKWDVESIIRQLEGIRDSVQQDVDLTVMKTWLQTMEKYDKYANPVLETIRKEIEDAKLNGKDAQRCYDAALDKFKNIDYVAMSAARKCQDISKCSIKDHFSFIDNYINSGQELIKELDNIFPDCHQKHSRLTDIFKLYSCINDQFGITKISVKNLKTDASSAKATAKNAFNVVIQQYDTCINEAYSTARSTVVEARSDATRCLNSLNQV